MIPLQLGIPGGPELLIILLLAILLFGASRIPKLARSSGEAIGEFQKGRREVEEELEEMKEGDATAGNGVEPEPTGADEASRSTADRQTAEQTERSGT